MKKVAFVLLMVFLISGMIPHHVTAIPSGENEVHVAYFYADGCATCEQVEPIIASLEKNLSFLKIERYDAKENYELYNDIHEKYHSHYGVPTAFIGNRWYYLNPNNKNFSETVEEFKQCILDYEKIGGVECPVQGDKVVFPKPVCSLVFYNFSNESEVKEATKFEDSLNENITYTKINDMDTSLSINMENFNNLRRGTNVSLPAIFIGNRSFSMEDSNLTKVVEYGKKYDMVGLPCPGYKAICVILFYNPLCHECMEAKDKLESMKSEYPLDLKEYNSLSKEGTDLLFRYYNMSGISGDERGSFAIFIGDKYYYKLSQFDELEQEIKKHVDTGLPCPEPSEEGNAEETLRSFTILTVIAGGLVDGINPCAFATLIFFIAYMEKVKRRKKELLSIGISFSLGVFLGYLLIGVGLMEFYYGMEGIGILSKYIYLFTGIFALILAAFNIGDYFRIGSEEKTVLQLPRFLKRRRGRLIKTLTGDRHMAILAVLAFVTGLGISMLEFVCTGQILFPIMAVIKSASALKMTAFGYLLLYNTMFITPLLAILALFYSGYSSEELGEMQKRRHGMVKIVTAAVLAIIGAYMLYISFS